METTIKNEGYNGTKIKLSYSSDIINNNEKPVSVEGYAKFHIQSEEAFCLDEEVYEFMESHALSELVENALVSRRGKGRQLVKIISITQDLIVDPLKKNVSFFLRGFAIYR
jgi:hypothetical protein